MDDVLFWFRDVTKQNGCTSVGDFVQFIMIMFIKSKKGLGEVYTA